MISVHFQGKSFNITVIQVYAPTTNAEENEVEWFCEDLQDLLEPIQNKAKQNKKPFFHHKGLECKSRKSRDTWRKRANLTLKYEVRAKANRTLPREQICHIKHPLPTQEMTLHMGITRWLILKSYYSFCSWRWRSSIQSAKTRLWFKSSALYCKIQAQTEEIREIGLLLGFPGGLMIKNPPAMQETWLWSWVGKIPWKRVWQATPVFLPGESPMDRGIWWATVLGVTKSWTWLND